MLLKLGYFPFKPGEHHYQTEVRRVRAIFERWCPLAQKYGVMGVPKIVVNEDHAFEGAMPDPMFLDQVKNAVA